MKLKVINKDLWIIIDGSDISEDNYYLDDTNTIRKSITSDKDYWIARPDYKKITHSTKPIEEICCTPGDQIKRYINCIGCDKKRIGYNTIKPISISEVEELVYGYSGEKMAKIHIGVKPDLVIDEEERYYLSRIKEYDAYNEGFKAHQELTKDKLFPIEDMRKALWCLGDILFNNNQNGINEGEPEKY